MYARTRLVLSLIGLLLLMPWRMAAQPQAAVGEVHPLPLRMRPLLSGNYGELRSGHFHAGLDFKTQQTVGHPVYAFDDGYVWRAVINAYGYGLALYVKHPQTGLMTVYGHLDAFRPDIAQRVRDYSVAHEANNPDVRFAPGDFPVRRGDEIAKSGNTGSSGGPHVHFEVRGMENDEFYDPMEYFLAQIADTRAPELRGVYLYPLGGTACGQRVRQTANLVTPKGQAGGAPRLSRDLTAWGRVGIGIKAYDRMDGTTNIYGVKYVRLYVDDVLVFDFAQRRFHYDERRYTNSLTDYAAWRRERSMIMKCFREPENRLRMIDARVGDGTIDIREERPYRLRLELEDAHGNRTVFPFTIRGVRTALPAPRAPRGRWVAAGTPVAIDTLGARFELAAGNLYTDADLPFEARWPQGFRPGDDEEMFYGTLPHGPALPAGVALRSVVSPVYEVGDADIPLHGAGLLRLCDPEAGDPRKIYIARLTKDGATPLVTAYRTVPSDSLRSGWSFDEWSRRTCYEVQVTELGRYVLMKDTEPPTIAIEGQASHRRVTLRMKDAGSGIATWRGEIDGRFVPFDMDNRGLYVARPEEFGVVKGRTHEIRMTATDRCGNVREFRATAWF